MIGMETGNKNIPLARRAGALGFLLLFTNTASWVFFFAMYPEFRVRLPAPLMNPEVWFFAIWYPLVFAGIALLGERDRVMRLKLFLSGYLCIPLFHNCLWLLLRSLWGTPGDTFLATLGPLHYNIPFFALILPADVMAPLALFFVFVAAVSIYSRSSSGLLASAACVLFLVLEHFGANIYLISVAGIAAVLISIVAASNFAAEYRERRSLWSENFHPMLAIFAFVISACAFCYGTFRGGLLWADLTLYGGVYTVVLIVTGYAMARDWHPFSNIFERAKLFLVFWLFEAIFYDWSWWSAYIFLGGDFRWSDPFYVDILLPHTTMATFLAVGVFSLFLGIYTFLRVKTFRGLIPVAAYFFVLFAMVVYKLLLKKSSWPFAICVYVAAAAAAYIATKYGDRHHI